MYDLPFTEDNLSDGEQDLRPLTWEGTRPIITVQSEREPEYVLINYDEEDMLANGSGDVGSHDQYCAVQSKEVLNQTKNFQYPLHLPKSSESKMGKEARRRGHKVKVPNKYMNSKEWVKWWKRWQAEQHVRRGRTLRKGFVSST